MAYKKSYKKITRYRGGYRLSTPNRVGNMLGSVARFAWKNRAGIVKKAEELFPGITGTASALGAEAMRHGLAKISSNARPVSLPLIPTATVPSVSQGEVSVTKYIARHKCPKTTLAIKRSLTVAQRLELSYVTGYRVVNSSGNVQGLGDMSNSSGNSTGTATIPVTALHSICGGSHVTSAGALQSGILNIMNQNVAGYGGPGYSNSTKFFLTSCNVETEISNISAYPLLVDIYEVMAKEDLVGHAGTSSYGVNGSSVYSPVQFWTSGLGLNNTPNVGAALGPTNVTARPYDNEFFNQYWRICSKITVALSAGDVHRHHSSYGYNKVINMVRSNSSSLIRNLTRNIMVVVQGTTVQDSSASPVVAFGPSAVNVTHQVHYKYMALPYSGSYDAYININKALTSPLKTVGDGWASNSTLNPM